MIYSTSRTITYSTVSRDGSLEGLALSIRLFGLRMLRYGLVVVLGWIGAMNFTGYDVSGIGTLVTRQLSEGLGIVEVAIAVLLSLRHWLPVAAAIGSAAAVLMFLTTLSFLFSTAAWEPGLGGFPALSLGEALRAASRRRGGRS